MTDPHDPEPSPTSSIAVHYGHDLPGPGARKGSFFYEGRSVVRITGGYRGRQEIGLWEKMVDPGQLESAQRVLRQSRYREISARGGSRPGTPFVTFEEEDSDTHERNSYCFRLGDLPPAILPAIEKFDALMDLVLAHPVRVLRGSGKWAKRKFSSHEELVAHGQLMCVGTAEVEVGNPVGSSDERAKGSLGLHIEPAGHPTEALGVDITGTNVLGQSPNLPGLIIRLAPGKSWKVRIAKRLHAAPGVYRGWLFYRSSLWFTKDGPETYGDIAIDLGEMTVVPPSP